LAHRDRGARTSLGKAELARPFSFYALRFVYVNPRVTPARKIRFKTTLERIMATHELQDTPAQRNNGLVLDRRLTVLETRFDTTLTMLTTKADLSELKAELKADIHGESARLSKWAAATVITMVIGFGGMIMTMLSRLPHA
jgi:hypothetical protein